MGVAQGHFLSSII